MPIFNLKRLSILAIYVVFSGCATQKYLGVEDYLLTKNKLNFEDKSNIENFQNIKYQLTTLYKQKPNKAFFFVPREWIYFKINQKEKQTKFDKWMLKYLAETPTLYNAALSESTAQVLQNYLRVTGYYDAEVKFEEDLKNKTIVANYYIKSGKWFTIDTAYYTSEDSEIQHLLDDHLSGSYLKMGEGLDRISFEKERDRVVKLMRTNGYAYFNSNYIAPLEADTTGGESKARVRFQILPPFNALKHKKYYVGDITIYADLTPGQPVENYTDTIIGEITFRKFSDEFIVKSDVLEKSTLLKKGDLYNQENYDNTFKSLSNLSIYRFVRIKYEPQGESDTLNFIIELTPSQKMEMGLDFEVNYTNRSTSAGTGNLIGITLSPSLRHRNIFKGAESLFSSLSLGAEINQNVKGPRLWNTIDIRLQNDLVLPTFNDYLGIWNRLYKLRLSRLYNTLDVGSVTRITTSFNYLHLLDFYRYNLFNAAYGYEVTENEGKRYFINHIGVDFLLPEINPGFLRILGDNTFFERSFGRQLFVGLIFREIGYTFSGRQNRFGETNYFGINFEVSGLEIQALNSLYNRFSEKTDTFSFGTTDFSKYIRLEFDGRYIRQITSKRSVAGRINIGFATPFGYSTEVPYVKQFYVGGPNSIRGWAARGLGPGGYDDPLTTSNRNRLLFYQTGDIKLEGSAEYRFDMFWRIRGALFLDVGNVWTLKEDIDRIGSQLLFLKKELEVDGKIVVVDPFYRQFAIGSGMGLRFDFSYFLFRLDMGIRLRNPFPTSPASDMRSERYYWRDLSKFGLRDINFNFALGLPF
jgi:outer membrane protein insertion porin family